MLARKHAGRSHKVYLQLGRERSAQQRYAEAKDAYQAVLRIDPSNSEALQFIEHFKKTGGSSSPAAKPSTGSEDVRPRMPSRSICCRKPAAALKKNNLPGRRPFSIKC